VGCKIVLGTEVIIRESLYCDDFKKFLWDARKKSLDVVRKRVNLRRTGGIKALCQKALAGFLRVPK
jgi:hypothetical protein